ncbi:aminoglycoside phosphotransferase family protein [Cyanobacterium stanieri LEGE 03274]|uniref:Aminoglycoside phosphotransferase family protein n=1 Tax=Cyanobacterium stanieri LEGE 03274 TaxID=1828756 RepID=A0ABR9V0N0_9CHRO|nr:aminoglycoside phosphotransferase family protein [Cyanobacterium stanieri]MBE9221438.1 aminoglycoside phosphotransferase family protein [Cyanobacterium stanieri LEGE 03274]
MNIINKYNLSSDKKMVFLTDILNKDNVESYFNQFLSDLMSKYQLKALEVIRYKPEKRCLIEFTFEGDNSLILIGKIKAKGTDFKTYNLQQKLWENGFNNDCLDQISVPQPFGLIPPWQMWLQKKVSGKVLTDLFNPEMNRQIIEKIPYVIRKLHLANIATVHSHLIVDELSILHQKLPLVLKIYPHWESQIKDILKKCDSLGQLMEENHYLCGIHRDFYFDQIIVDDEHFYLLDLDLYCLGNPSLDMGNFLGHIIEYSLRRYGHFHAFKAQENILENEFISLVGEDKRKEMRIYTILTLVRHIYLSTLFPERQFSTPILFDYCQGLLTDFG